MNKLTFIPFLLLIFGLNSEASAAGAHLPNFREVVNGSIYRGGVPTQSGVEELSKMGIRTVLSIRDEDPLGTKKEGEWARKLGMTFISIPLSDLFAPSDKNIDAIEAILTDERFYPIYLHCTHGQDRVGLVIGLYRVFYQNMSPHDAYQEMLGFGFKRFLIGFRHYFEKRTGYDTDDVHLEQPVPPNY